MTAKELADRLTALVDQMGPDTPVILWNDADGSHGDARYVIATDGQITIAFGNED